MVVMHYVNGSAECNVSNTYEERNPYCVLPDTRSFCQILDFFWNTRRCFSETGSFHKCEGRTVRTLQKILSLRNKLCLKAKQTFLELRFKISTTMICERTKTPMVQPKLIFKNNFWILYGQELLLKNVQFNFLNQDVLIDSLTCITYKKNNLFYVKIYQLHQEMKSIRFTPAHFSVIVRDRSHVIYLILESRSTSINSISFGRIILKYWCMNIPLIPQEI